MFKKIWKLLPILLIVNLLACKNEPPAITAEPLKPGTEVNQAPTTGSSNINFISKEKIALNDKTEIVFPKEDDKSSIVFYFATPGETFEGKTSLSEQGQLRSQQITAAMAKAGLAIVYIDGNTSMQTALGAARANFAEFNVFKADKAAETLKLLVGNYMGKKVMVVAEAAVVTSMMAELTGKPAPAVPATPNNNLYVAIAKGIGDGEVKTLNY
jgi:hypothetical protein